jgi:hypothetical protein
MKVLLALLVLALCPAAALAAPDQEATFQDDNVLIYATPAQQHARVAELKRLGVDRIRMTILWRAIAPSPKSRTRPAGFNATDPAAYPAGVWDKYDNLVREAKAAGLGVNFNVTGPSPTWANKRPPRPDIADNFEPSPSEFGQFVFAVGARYSGTDTDAARVAIPRVDYWSIWNEPNHSGWLTPTWQKSGGVWYERSASLYRSLLDSAWQSLAASGHGTDTILFGETAPVGSDKSRDVKRFMTPLRFVRALYCVDQHDHRLTGRAAKRLSCPSSAKAFYTAHPALFHATGYGHHPYQLILPPRFKPTNHNYVTIGVLSRLERTLDTIQRRYGQHKRFPLYLTEFGYQTPPDPQGVRPRKQAAFINESEYLVSRDRRVRTLSQFLLRDGGAPVGLTFQSGLETHAGKHKPAYAAYRLPIWVTGSTSHRRVWGVARPAARNARVRVAIQFRRHGSSKWRTLRRVTTQGAHNEFIASVTAGRGAIRFTYAGLRSRSAPVR